MPARDRDESDSLRVVTDLRDEARSLLDDFVEPILHCMSPAVRAVAIIRMGQSAWEVPVIMFLMKSRWPGASMT
jgi:hypothetical protein